MSTAKPTGIKAPSKIAKPSGTAASRTNPGTGAKVAATDKSAASASGGDAQSSEESFQVGERVWVNGNKPGYVQFLGETQFAPGQWAGIVLDEAIGKNDGSVAGVRYFQCEALRGIFTRPSKLSRTEGEANGTQTAPPSRAASPTPSVGSVASHTPATKSSLPSTTTAKKGSTATPVTPATPSNLTRTNSESVSNLSETGSVKKGERELKMGDRVLNSAFALDEDPQSLSSSSVKTTTESFKVTGSVLHFTTFSLDKLGQPLVNENPSMTDGWEVPTYHQVFSKVVGTDGEVEMKDKRPKSMCFNCGLSTHQMRDCPKPKDMAAINERRKEFNQNNNQAMQSNQRYHADEVEERFAKYKAGAMSEELLTALGLDAHTLPPLIYRMRQLGYPPGWLKEAEMENSGLALYDGNVSNDGSAADGSNSHKISYDVSKLVDFPGFNVPAPHMRDEFMQFGSIPMQSSHMKQNYAAYLSNNFPGPGANSNKRPLESSATPQQRKKTRSSPDRSSDQNSDMDLESDPGTPYHSHGQGNFQFQPPLPPSSPCFSSPPPLPQGTPPSTPTPPPLPKGTPPPTPTNGSPALRGRSWVTVDETAEGTEDELTLEELEEQQRLIWAALENSETATNSDSETPAMGTPVPSSPSVSTPVHVDTESEEVEEMMDTTKPSENSQNNESQKQQKVQSPGPIKVEEDSPQSPEQATVKNGSSQSPALVKVIDDSTWSPGSVRVIDDSPQSPESVLFKEGVPDQGFLHGGGGNCASPEQVEKIVAVPHRSNFAAGIVSFEDTPEFTEVAEATGTYLKIRDLLKSSPRSLAKKK